MSVCLCLFVCLCVSVSRCGCVCVCVSLSLSLSLSLFIRATSFLLFSSPLPSSQVIIVYAVAGFLGLLLICYAYYRWRKHLNKVHLNETQYLARMKLREKPPAERKKEPVPFFYPDEDFLALEHSNKNDNPDFDRVIRVGARARKTGVVKDKRGAIIGTISSGGVIRDKTGRRIGVSSYGAQPTEAKRKAEDNMRVGYFGGTT